MGLAPQSAANAASERNRSGLPPAVISSWGGGVGSDAVGAAQAGVSFGHELVEQFAEPFVFVFEALAAGRERLQRLEHGLFGDRAGGGDPHSGQGRDPLVPSQIPVFLADVGRGDDELVEDLNHRRMRAFIAERRALCRARMPSTAPASLTGVTRCIEAAARAAW